MTDTPTPTSADVIEGEALEPEAPWVWRNCRNLAIGVRLWLWPWAFGFHKGEDCYGGSRAVYFGPMEITLTYSIGNVSAETWYERAFALCETEAWQRALAVSEAALEDSKDQERIESAHRQANPRPTKRAPHE